MCDLLIIIQPDCFHGVSCEGLFLEVIMATQFIRTCSTRSLQEALNGFSSFHQVTNEEHLSRDRPLESEGLPEVAPEGDEHHGS